MVGSRDPKGQDSHLIFVGFIVRQISLLHRKRPPATLCLKPDHLETLQKNDLHSNSSIDIPELGSDYPSLVGSLAHPGMNSYGQRQVQASMMA